MRHLPVAKSIKDAAAEQFSLGRSVRAVDVCILSMCRRYYLQFLSVALYLHPCFLPLFCFLDKLLCLDLAEKCSKKELHVPLNCRDFLHFQELSALRMKARRFNMLDGNAWVDFMLKLEKLKETSADIQYTPYNPTDSDPSCCSFKAFLQVYGKQETIMCHIEIITFITATSSVRVPFFYS